jgi:23S rRNA (pseudouridine1915-N3)-methyltransferase
LKFVILAVGRSKFPFVEHGLRHYFENIRHMAELEYVELKDHGSEQKREAELFRETLERRKFLGGGTKVFLLDERGKAPTSPEFAAQLGALRDQGIQRFVFVVGGAYGFSEELRGEFPLLSLSRLTFPHDLARLLLAEQIYRALHILAGGKYHHGE